jgi:hypothetical protein
MPSSGTLRRVALVRTDVSNEHCACIIRVTRIGEPGTTLAVTSNRNCCCCYKICLRSVRRLLVTPKVASISPIFVTLIMDPLRSSETSVLTRATRRNIPEDGIFQFETCKIWGFHGDDSEEWCILGCYAVWLLWEPTFQRNLAPPSSGWQESVN